MDRESLAAIYRKYDLQKKDIYNHKHYLIVTRSGIEKIQAEEGIKIDYTVCGCARDYCIVKARATKGKVTIETLASAVQGGKVQKEVNGKKKWVEMGSTDSRYLAEMAEKRAMSRAVLKITGLYKDHFFGEDEEPQDDNVSIDDTVSGFSKT